MTEATNKPVGQTSPRECQDSGGTTNWLAEQGFDFVDFAAFLRRQDHEWLIECATRSARTPGKRQQFEDDDSAARSKPLIHSFANEAVMQPLEIQDRLRGPK